MSSVEGGAADRRPPPDPRGEEIPGASTLGMQLLLATLGVLFLASLAFYLLMRFRLSQWPPEGAPGLPAWLWLSTFVLIGSSMTIHYALHSVRLGRQAQLRLGLAVTFAAALVFLAVQALAWAPLLAYQAQAQAQQGATQQLSLYKLAFFMLAGLHAAHVLGGLIPLGIISAAAGRKAYDAQHHLPVKHIAMYWHFLDVVWLAIFIALLATQ